MRFEFILSTTNVIEKRHYLYEALHSIDNQDYLDYGIAICIDGGPPLSYPFRSKHRIIHNSKRLGLAASLNSLIASSNAQYLVRMDDDDISYNIRLKEIDRFIREQTKRWCVIHSAYDSKETGLNLLRSSHFIRNSICHPSVVFNRQELLGLNLKYDERMMKSQDYKLWLDILISKGNILYFEKSLIYYRIHDLQVTRSRSLPKRALIIQNKLWLMIKCLVYFRLWSSFQLVLGLVYEIVLIVSRTAGGLKRRY